MADRTRVRVSFFGGQVRFGFPGKFFRVLEPSSGRAPLILKSLVLINRRNLQLYELAHAKKKQFASSVYKMFIEVKLSIAEVK